MNELVAQSFEVDAEQAVAAAYQHVADGYRRALRVTGLPDDELECLRRTLRAVQQLAQQPLLSPVR